MMQHTTESKSLKTTNYPLARQFAAKYFPNYPIDGTYAVLDTVNATVDGQVKIPLTVSNAI